MSNDNVRTAFEVWADDQGYPLGRLDIGDGDDYSDMRTDGAWGAWQAALAAPAQPNTWREAVLDALTFTGSDMPATATPAEIVREVIDAHVQIALDPRVSDAAPAQQPEPATLPEHQRSAPLVIYLHDGDDGHTEPFPDGTEDGVTWSADNATSAGVRYVRADIAAPAQQPLTWYDGAPPFPQDQEWFIAETIYGDRVVLRSLDEGREHKHTYDFKTADGTYMLTRIVKRWMQFPGCNYLPPETKASSVKDPKRA